MNKREQQRLDRRQQILECCLDMIVSRGYEAMKTRDITEKLHISTGLIFNYFGSKEKIFEELVMMGVNTTENILRSNEEIKQPIEYFKKITETIFEGIQSYSMTAKMFLLMAQAINSESTPENVRKIASQLNVINPLISIISHGQKLHQIKEGDPEALVMAYWGAVQGIAGNYANGQNQHMPKSAWIVDILRAY